MSKGLTQESVAFLGIPFPVLPVGAWQQNHGTPLPWAQAGPRKEGRLAIHRREAKTLQGRIHIMSLVPPSVHRKHL